MSSPSARGWGANCQVPIVNLKRGDGLVVGLHPAIGPLVAMLLDLTEIGHGYRARRGETWGYCCRTIKDTATPSNHSWGLAIDINAPANPMNSLSWHAKHGEDHPSGRVLRTDIPMGVVELWEDHGFRWGGQYRTRPDPMHFEFMGTPDEAQTVTSRLRAFLGAHVVVRKDSDMMQIIDIRDGTVYLVGTGEQPRSLGGEPEVHKALVAAGIPAINDDGTILDFLLKS